MAWFGVSWLDGIAGFGVGVLFATGVAWWGVRLLTERARSAERRARAAEHMADIGSMTGGLAHEIKNPLSTIGLNAQLLAEAIEELPGDEQERQRLVRRSATLLREVDRLRDILADFLEFAGELRISAAPTDLNVLVEELADFFLPQAESEGVRLRVERSPAPAVASVDAARLKQAVLNLMINALQSMAGAAAADRPKELMLRVRPRRDDVLELHVTDTGPGMPPDTAERVFRPYFTTKAGGTGLGLPTARRIVEASGGTLGFTSELDRGTDFVIALPHASSEGLRPATADSRIHSSETRGRPRGGWMR
ncbi:MAG: ATP-binding protein [Planctomycetota bacterium]